MQSKKMLNRLTNKHPSSLLLLTVLLISSLSLVQCSHSEQKEPPQMPGPRAYEGVSQAPEPASVTPPPFGWLQVDAQGRLLSEAGEEVQLRGMSSHGLQWFSDLINRQSLVGLREDWQGNLLRLAMYTDEGGYAENPKVKEDLILAANTAIELGLYVIIDWHILKDNDPEMNQQLAKPFFAEMAERYGKYPHVIFEIANEPHGLKANGDPVNWQNSIKPYANTIIPIIREKAPENLVIVGTANYSLEIQEPASDPLAFENIMYTVHFYAGGIDPETGKTGYLQTGIDWLQDKIVAARTAGIAVFVTEWGTSGWDGGSGNDFCAAYQWVTFMDKHKISWANWSISTKDESSAALVQHERASQLESQALSPSGKFIRHAVRGDYQAGLEAVGMSTCKN